MQRPCFIYAIIHSASGKRYVGSTINKNYRFIKHRSELKNKRHHCRHLQNAWNKYGVHAFEFVVLKELPTNDRVIRAIEELKFINELPCYNSRTAHTNLTNFINSPETNRRIQKGIRQAIATNPEYAEFLKNRAAELVALMRSPEGRKRAGDVTRKRWQDKQEQKKMMQGLINRWTDPNAREKQSVLIKQNRWSDDYKNRQAEYLKKQWADPNSPLRNRKNGRWSDPLAKAEQAEKMRAYHARRRAET